MFFLTGRAVIAAACLLLAAVTGTSLALANSGGDRPIQTATAAVQDGASANAYRRRTTRSYRRTRTAPRRTTTTPTTTAPSAGARTRRTTRYRRTRTYRRTTGYPHTRRTYRRPSTPTTPSTPSTGGSGAGGSAGGSTTTPSRPVRRTPAPTSPALRATPHATPTVTTNTAPAAKTKLRPFGTSGGQVKERSSLKAAKAKGRSHARARSAKKAAGVSAATRKRLVAVSAIGAIGAPKAGGAAHAKKRAAKAKSAQDCAPGSRDVITRLVAFVPPALKLFLGIFGGLAALFAIATFVNRRKLAVARSRAVTDALTGLPDHSSIHEELDAAVLYAKRTSTPLSVVLIDLDNFKRINDTYGHLKGDEVLRAVSNTARNALRGPDFVGRYGGEEFMAILPGSDREGAVAVIDRLRKDFWEMEVAGVRELVTASMGVSTYPQDGAEGSDLIGAADDALYAAKAAGRNQVRTASPLDAGPRRAAAVMRPAFAPARPTR